MKGETDPRRLYFDNDPGRQSRVMEELEVAETYIPVVERAFDYPLRRLPGLRYMDHFWAGRFFYGHAFYALTSFTYMKDWCRQHYSDEGKSPNFYDNCATAHVNNGANPEIMP